MKRHIRGQHQADRLLEFSLVFTYSGHCIHYTFRSIVNYEILLFEEYAQIIHVKIMVQYILAFVVVYLKNILGLRSVRSKNETNIILVIIYRLYLAVQHDLILGSRNLSTRIEHQPVVRHCKRRAVIHKVDLRDQHVAICISADQLITLIVTDRTIIIESDIADYITLL